MAPLARAFASRSESERVVIIITGVLEPRAESSSFKSIPFIPGM